MRKPFAPPCLSRARAQRRRPHDRSASAGSGFRLGLWCPDHGPEHRVESSTLRLRHRWTPGLALGHEVCRRGARVMQRRTGPVGSERRPGDAKISSGLAEAPARSDRRNRGKTAGKVRCSGGAAAAKESLSGRSSQVMMMRFGRSVLDPDRPRLNVVHLSPSVIESCELLTPRGGPRQRAVVGVPEDADGGARSDA